MQAYSTEAFYDSIADKYNWFFSSRDKIAEMTANQIAGLIQPYNPKTILDCSCGDGMQAVPLAQRGFAVTAGDISENMIRKATECAQKAGVSIPFRKADFRRLEDVFKDQYDIVLSWGNSIAHMMTPDDIAAAIRSIYRRVKNGGAAVFEMRNYDVMLLERKRFLPMCINSIQDGYRYSILYVFDYLAGLIRFNIVYLIEDIETGKTHMEQESVDYNPILEADFREYLRQAGFKAIDADASRNGICYVAQK